MERWPQVCHGISFGTQLEVMVLVWEMKYEICSTISRLMGRITWLVLLKPKGRGTKILLKNSGLKKDRQLCLSSPLKPITILAYVLYENGTILQGMSN